MLRISRLRGDCEAKMRRIVPLSPWSSLILLSVPVYDDETKCLRREIISIPEPEEGKSGTAERGAMLALGTLPRLVVEEDKAKPATQSIRAAAVPGPAWPVVRVRRRMRVGRRNHEGE
jgi:hypothetical protein